MNMGGVVMARVEKILIVSILFLSLMLAWAGQATSAEGKLALRVGYVPLLSQLPLVVSFENDRMNLEKVEPQLIKYSSFTGLEAAMRVGAIDLASLPVPIALSMAADGHKVKLIGACHRGGSRLVAQTKGDLKSVRGNLIGVPGLDSDENLKLGQVLGAADLRAGLDYKTIGVSFATVINDLKAQKIDAFYLPEPFGTIAEKEKIAVQVEGQEGKLTGTLDTVLVIRSEVLEKRKEAVEEWLESLATNCQFIENDIKKTGAKQTAIIQGSYFDYPEGIVTSALLKRKGGLEFDHFVLSEEEIRGYMDLATQVKLLTKSVDLKSLISTDSTKKLSKLRPS